MLIKAKICGLTDVSSVEACVEGKASFIGFVFVEHSPRTVSPKQAYHLAQNIPAGIASVALCVNPTNDDLDKIFEEFSPDIIQLHGQETIKRVKEIKEKYHRPIIKAVGIDSADDVTQSCVYHTGADMMLYDAKPKMSQDLTGGNGHIFPWDLLQPLRTRPKPYFVAGGITKDNVLQALSQSQADYVDLSSGVEISRGVKSPQLIKEFLKLMKTYAKPLSF